VAAGAVVVEAMGDGKPLICMDYWPGVTCNGELRHYDYRPLSRGDD
jgi:hypothetical protein